MSEIIIRQAEFTDLEQIAYVEASCFNSAEAATKEEFADRLKHYKNHFWLMFIDDKLIAFTDGFVTNSHDLTDEMYAKAQMHDENGSWQMIFGINTLPEYRRKGYAAQLVQKLVCQAKDQGRKGVVLTCKDSLVHYYEKFGFVNEGISRYSTHGFAVWNQMRLVF